MVRVITIIDIGPITIIDGSFHGRTKYRWPLLSSLWCDGGTRAFLSACGDWIPSPAPNPGNVAAKAMAKIDRGLMQRLFRGGRPKLELVTVTAAAMATVATDRYVH
jgi:hypothetical protein